MSGAWTAVKEILRGTGITARHFFVNMGLHTLGLFGVRTKRRGAVTIQYPEVRKPLAPRHRSLHRLRPRGDGRPSCVACMLCVTVCPAECITVEAAEDPDPEVQKAPARFVVDLDRCCFCGFCVEACPVDAIRMDTGEIRLASTERADFARRLDRP
ncbi:MAG TPA: NADH-quinone oxidoreductase subunit I [Candidatus Aminicenantes bacterium]|nr:NADH-quinone oxidoreductase subunit I [Candidatus Aminicenantes bacterium]